MDQYMKKIVEERDYWYHKMMTCGNIKEQEQFEAFCKWSVLNKLCEELA